MVCWKKKMLLVHADTEASKTNLSVGGGAFKARGIRSDPSTADVSGVFSAEVRFFHYRKMKWSRHYSSTCFSHTLTHMYTQPLLMSWLCLLVVHSMIEMGVWVLSGCKSACQLAFSALFPISIKHPHHLLWAHSTASCFPPVSCCTDRWPVINTNHFSSHIEVCLLLMFISILADWMVEWEFEHWYWDETI